MALAADVVATVVVFGFSLALDNSSMYDPYWSVAPVPIVALLGHGARGPGRRWRCASPSSWSS